MEKNKICPYCGALIADDSYFCDQCGEQLHICPQCHQYGKGKFCKHCGTQMVVVNEDELFEAVDSDSAAKQNEEPSQSEGTLLIDCKDEAISQESNSDSPTSDQVEQPKIINPIAGTTLPKINIKL